MDVTCNVIEDLLPLYADGICSEDTKTIIEHHTAVCPDCREKLEAMTAKLEKNEKKGEAKNPFKKVKNHYLRLVTVTLLVCAIIIVPSGGVWYLSTNTHFSNGYTWSSLKMEMEINSLCKLIKKGKYREFLEEVILPNQHTYSADEIANIKDLLAEDFEDYFKKYPIERIVINVDEGNCDSGDGNFILKTDEDYMVVQSIYFHRDYEYPEGIAIHYNGSEAVKGKDFSAFGTAEDNHGFGSIEKQCELNYGFPQFVLMPTDYAEGIFKSIDYDNEAISVGWIAELRSSLKGRFTQEFWKEKDEIEEKLEELKKNFRCINAWHYLVQYTKEVVDLGGGVTKDRLFIQPVKLNMKSLSGENFDVSFDMPIAIDGYPEYLLDLRNITYSDNTPEDFKTMFEDIFT